MFNYNKLFNKGFPVEYVCIPLYALITQGLLGITALSFEDHFLYTLVLHLFVLVFVPLRFRHQLHLIRTRYIYAYSFGFLIFHFVCATLASLFLSPICSLSQGLMWYVLLEIPSLFLLTSICCFALVNGEKKWAPYRWLIGFVLFFLFFNVFDLLQTPTLYLFHPTLGYYPGPIYDPWIPLPPSLFWSRLWSVGMGVVFWTLTKQYHIHWTALLLILPLFFRVPLGFRSTHASIQEKLGHAYETEHTIVYSEDPHLQPVTLDSLDYWVESIQAKLDLPADTKPIRIYHYPDDHTKKRLTGSQYTMIGNARQRALHVLSLSSFDPILIHELTHVVARPMKKNLLHMPSNMSKTEGLAMFVQENIRGKHVHQWVRALLSLQENQTLPEFKNTRSFYKLPSLHAYALAGSWTTHLIDTFGMDAYKNHYRGSAFEEAFGFSKSYVHQQWLGYLQSIQLDDEVFQRMKPYLLQKSIFQQRCPHELARAFDKHASCVDFTCRFRWAKRACHLHPRHPRAQRLYFQSMVAHNMKQDAYQFQQAYPEFQDDYNAYFSSPQSDPFFELFKEHPELRKAYHSGEAIPMARLLQIQSTTPKRDHFLWNVLSKRYYAQEFENVMILMETIEPSRLPKDIQKLYWKQKADVMEQMGDLNKALECVRAYLKLESSEFMLGQQTRLIHLQGVAEKKSPAQTKSPQW